MVTETDADLLDFASHLSLTSAAEHEALKQPSAGEESEGLTPHDIPYWIAAELETIIGGDDPIDWLAVTRRLLKSLEEEGFAITRKTTPHG